MAKKELVIILTILIGVFALISGLIIGAKFSANEEFNSPSISCKQEDFVQSVISSPTNWPEYTATIYDRISWDECLDRSGIPRDKGMCYITQYNPSLNLVRCVCWNFP